MYAVRELCITQLTSLYSACLAGYCSVLNAGTRVLKSQICELPLPWAPPAGAAPWGSGMVSLAQDAACAGKDLSLGWLLQHHPPCAWKEGKATATTAKFLLRFTGKRVAVGAGETLGSQRVPLFGRQLLFVPIHEIPRGKQTGKFAAALLPLLFISIFFILLFSTRD